MGQYADKADLGAAMAAQNDRRKPFECNEIGPRSRQQIRRAECERAAKDYWKIKDKVLVWSLRVATAALLLGVGGGALFKALFEH